MKKGGRIQGGRREQVRGGWEDTGEGERAGTGRVGGYRGEGESRYGEGGRLHGGRREDVWRGWEEIEILKSGKHMCLELESLLSLLLGPPLAEQD